jgi:hypothetical protein
VSAKACRVPGTGQKSEPLQQAFLAAMRRASSRVNSLGLLDGPELPFKLPFFPE